MKIEVAKADLESALAIAGIATATNGADLSTHYLFRLKDGQVEVLSASERVFARAPMVTSVEGDDGDAFTIEAWRLNKWISGVSDGVLKLSADGGGDVHASGPRSKVRFRSLDPSKFPYWDGLEASSEDVGTIDPRALSRALSVSRWFVSADDTSKPELCQVEAVDGVLWATDRRALSSVEMPLLPELNIRIPGKQVAAVVRFLNEKGSVETDITVRQASRSVDDGGGAHCTLVRADGAYVGVTRPTSSFPTLNVDREAEDDSKLEIDQAEFLSAIAVLTAGAPKGHESVTFSYDHKEKEVKLTMPCEAGGEDEYPLSLAKVTNGEKWVKPFTVDYPYINGIGSTFGLDSLTFGVNERGRGGFISFRHNDEEGKNGNRYFSVIVWWT